MDVPVTFAPVSPADAPALADLRVEAMRESLERAGRFDPERARQRLLAAFDAACTTALLVDGERVGFLVLRPIPGRGDALLLDHLYVHPAHHGRGIGTHALRHVFAQADRRRATVRVGALRGSDANRFYARHGFVPVEETPLDLYYERAPAPILAAMDEPACDCRAYEPRDLESLADLLTDMSVHYNGPDASDRATVRMHLEQRILGPDADVRLFVAVDADGTVQGMAAVSLQYPAPKERGQLYMKELYVHSAARGRDIGERLMRRVARHAVAHDCLRLDWTTERPNEGAQRFYRRLGAEHVEEKVYFRLAGDALQAFASDDR